VYCLRRRVKDAGVGKGARISCLDANVFIALACEGRWHVKDASVRKGARIGCLDASVLGTLALRRVKNRLPKTGRPALALGDRFWLYR
jgi:hypothetical protein